MHIAELEVLPIATRTANPIMSEIRYKDNEIPSPEPAPTSLDEQMQRLPRPERRLVENVECNPEQLDKLVKKLSNGHLIVAPDGSFVYDTDLGSFGWIITTTAGTVLVRAKDQSTRGEDKDKAPGRNCTA